MTTLASLAAELGVSRTTVSNAYNHPDQLSPALRRRILKAAQRRGYQGPNPAARNLRLNETGTVGVTLSELAFEDPATIEFLAGLSAASDKALTLVRDPAHLKTVAVDSFVAYSLTSDDELLGTPNVVCDQPYDLPDVSFIGVDDRGGMREAADYLAHLGHERIGILAKNIFSTPYHGLVSGEQILKATSHVQQARILGALDAIDASSPVMVSSGDPTEAAYHLIEACPEITAICCTTDTMALGALATGLMVTGFDDIPAAEAAGLTTIRQPMRRKGAEVAAALRDTQTRRVILPTQLVVRQAR